MRIIARLDIKNEFVIKGIQLEGLRKIGEIKSVVKKYYDDGIDEIFILDAVASYYDRDSLYDIISEISKNVFIPITVGGGVRTIECIKKLLKSGADKVAINSAAVKNPNFLKEASNYFGSQSIISNIDVKKNNIGWQVYIENGREPTNKFIKDWIKEVQDLGVGEILVTSVDRDGTKKGFDINLYSELDKFVQVPLIASGGCKSDNDLLNLFQNTDVDGAAIGSIFHYNISSINSCKDILKKNKIDVRKV